MFCSGLCVKPHKVISISSNVLISSNVPSTKSPKQLVLSRSISTPRQGGKIHLIYGPVGCGKTEELLRLRKLEFRRTQKMGTKTILVKYKGDDRYDSTAVVTHDGRRDNDTVVCELLSEIQNLVETETTVAVFIDECQFYPDLIPLMFRWSSMHKNITMAGLDAFAINFPHPEGRIMWPYFDTIALIAVKMTRLCSVCTECGNEATFSYCTEANKTPDANGKLIGGTSVYDNRCFFCIKDTVMSVFVDRKGVRSEHVKNSL